MMDQAQANHLCKGDELAFFCPEGTLTAASPPRARTDVCRVSPQSFTLEEKAVICDEMESADAAIDDAIRGDFGVPTPDFQGKLPGMPCASGCMTLEWWRKALFGAMPESTGKLAWKEA